MKSISAALATAYNAPVQQPAILVQIMFSTPVRWSSFSTLTWNGQTWTREDVVAEGVEVGVLSASGSLVIGNNDDVAAALVLNEGISDRSITLWGYDASASALPDVVWIGDFVGGGCEVTTDAVRISLRHRAQRLFTPRTFIDPALYGPLVPAGTVLRIGGVDYRVEKRG